MATALITGATAGLGLEFAWQLATAKHDVVLVARNEERLTRLAAQLEAAAGIRAEVLVADLSVRADVERVAERLRATERPVGLLVNNAGLGLNQRFVGGDLADEETALAVMVRAVMVLSHAAAGAMVARGRGAILNVASDRRPADVGHVLRAQGLGPGVHRGPRGRAARHRRHRHRAATRASCTPSSTSAAGST